MFIYLIGLDCGNTPQDIAFVWRPPALWRLESEQRLRRTKDHPQEAGDDNLDVRQGYATLCCEARQNETQFSAIVSVFLSYMSSHAETYRDHISQSIQATFYKQH